MPSSLKWLIDRRGRVDGEIKKIERSLAKCQSLIRDLEILKATLDSADRTLALHDIQVKPTDIPPIRSHEFRLPLPHGELTKLILECLKTSDGQPVSSDRIGDYVAERAFELHSVLIPQSQLTRSVHDRLKNLHRSGLLSRHHDPLKPRHGIWSIRETIA